MHRWQTFFLFALSELVCTKKVPYPIHFSLLIYPKLILLWSVTDWWRKLFTPSSLILFFSLSARGPTRRCNFTGLAELRGGLPIEPVKNYRSTNTMALSMQRKNFGLFGLFRHLKFFFCIFLRRLSRGRNEAKKTSNQKNFGPFFHETTKTPR